MPVVPRMTVASSLLILRNGRSNTTSEKHTATAHTTHTFTYHFEKGHLPHSLLHVPPPNQRPQQKERSSITLIPLHLHPSTTAPPSPLPPQSLPLPQGRPVPDLPPVNPSQLASSTPQMHSSLHIAPASLSSASSTDARETNFSAASLFGGLVPILLNSFLLAGLSLQDCFPKSLPSIVSFISSFSQ